MSAHHFLCGFNLPSIEEIFFIRHSMRGASKLKKKKDEADCSFWFSIRVEIVCQGGLTPCSKFQLFFLFMQLINTDDARPLPSPQRMRLY